MQLIECCHMDVCCHFILIVRKMQMCRLCRLCTTSSAQQIKRWKCFPQTKQKNADVQHHGAQLELDHRRDCGWQNAPWLATGFTILQLYRFCPFFVPISHISTFWSTQLFPALSSHFGEKTRKMLVLP